MRARFEAIALCSTLLAFACSESRDAEPQTPSTSGAAGLDDLTLDNLDPEETAEEFVRRSDRRIFDDRRYAIRWPTPLELVSRESEESVRHSAESRHDGASYALTYFVHDAPSREIANPDYVHFETTRFVSAVEGRDPAIERIVLREDRPAFFARFVSNLGRRDVHHELVSFVADRTMFFVHVVSATPEFGAALPLANSFQVLGQREDVAEATERARAEGSEELRAVFREAPTATTADRASAPTATRPGAPSVANSCNQISVVGHCYETAASVVGQGYFSNEEKCFSPHTFTNGPCPTAGRRGSCVLSGGGQVVHFYAGDDNEAACRRFSGRYRPATPRVFPRNGR